MNPVYSPGSSGVPYANAKGIGYPGDDIRLFCVFFSSWFPHGLHNSGSCLFPQHVPWSESYLPNRLHPWHTLQSVLFAHQWNGTAVLLLSQPLSDCCVPRAKCLPPAEPICTARHVLYTAPVCSTPPRHPPHHGGAAQWHAGDGVSCSHPSTERQWGHHGHGSWDHYGHVSRYPADRPLPNSCCPPPSHCAHLSGSRNTYLQLRAPSVVIACKC
ncbi:myelin-associated neurite-outgrowth inhibitor isoform 1-T1 [Hipposideros larvatus]